MGVDITQYRSAIGNFNNFIKSKLLKCLMRLMSILVALVKFFGVYLLLMMAMFPFNLYAIVILLLRSGDIELNPGPIKFCHLNARSLLAGVDITQHIQHQYSLLDDIYECLVYQNEFDLIAISETWLKDNVPLTELDLAGYDQPFIRNRGSRGGGSWFMLEKALWQLRGQI